MKRFVLVLAVALMGTIVINAQPPRRPGMDPKQSVEKRIERLDKALSLTEEQKVEIANILNEEQQAMRNDKFDHKEKSENKDKAAMKDRHEKMKAQRDATNAKIEAILTPEQAEKYAQIKKQHSERRHHPKGYRGLDNAVKQQQGCCDKKGKAAKKQEGCCTTPEKGKQ